MYINANFDNHILWHVTMSYLYAWSQHIKTAEK